MAIHIFFVYVDLQEPRPISLVNLNEQETSCETQFISLIFSIITVLSILMLIFWTSSNSLIHFQNLPS